MRPLTHQERLNWALPFAAWAVWFAIENSTMLLAWLDQHPEVTAGLAPLSEDAVVGGLEFFMEHAQEYRHG